MENIHEVQYLIQTNDGLFLSQPHIPTLYTEDPMSAQFFENFNIAKEVANHINYLNNKNKDLLPPRQVRVIRHEIYHTYDESIDKFPDNK